GICLIHPGGITSWAVRTTDKTLLPHLAIYKAARDILYLMDTLAEGHTLIVGIEEYAFGMSKNRGYSWTIEAGGILKMAVEGAAFPAPIPVPASAWKKSMFGKQTLAPRKTGPGCKQNYLAEMKRVSDHDFPTPDEADAWCVA